MILTACLPAAGVRDTFHLSEHHSVRETQSEDGLGLGGRGPVGRARPREAPLLLHTDSPRTRTGMGQKRYSQGNWLELCLVIPLITSRGSSLTEHQISQTT